MDENTNIPQNNEAPSQNNQPNLGKKFLLSKLFNNPKVLILSLALLALLVVAGIFVAARLFKDNKVDEDKVVGTLSGRSITTGYLQKQNIRLEGFSQEELSEDEEQELSDLRVEMLAYAKKNNILVTDEEVRAEVDRLYAQQGDSVMQASLLSHGWTRDDLIEATRWRLLIQKIIDYVKPTRSGEAISVRWDGYVPEVTQALIAQRKPVAEAFLTELKLNLDEKTLESIYEFITANNLREDPTINGYTINEFQIQYTGWNEETSAFDEFLLDPKSSDYQILIGTQPQTTSEIECTDRGCNLYNITSGSSAHPNGEDLVNKIIKLKISF